MLRNCVNCGAPLCGCKCEYCGTEYGDERGQRISATFGEDDSYGSVQIGNRTYECYIGKMEAVTIDGLLSGRDATGRFIRQKIATKHIFTLIER